MRERQFRQKELKKKQFNVPMCRFLEMKYPEIYGEYKELYALLVKNHPHTRDLTKTCTFKTWQLLNQSTTNNRCKKGTKRGGNESFK